MLGLAVATVSQLGAVMTTEHEITLERKGIISEHYHITFRMFCGCYSNNIDITMLLHARVWW